MRTIDDTQIYGVDAEQDDRPLWPAIKKGLKCKCPNCGEGALFSGFTKPVEVCEVCGEDLSHQRADDFPAYLNITVVGHIVLGLFVMVYVFLDWPNWLHMVLWGPLTVIMALALIQPIKGGVIAMQWANRMHGFGGEEDPLDKTSVPPEHHG